MSSVDSFEIDIPINDNVYVKQIDNYRMSIDDEYFRMSIESESGSGSDEEHKKITFPEAMQRLEKYLDSNELDVLRYYIQSKKQVFEHAAQQESFKYRALNIHSFIATIALAFLPWFYDTQIAISVISAFILAIQQWIHYSGCGIHAQLYLNNSRSYSTLLVHFDKSKFMSNATLLKNLECKLECIDHPIPAHYNKRLPILSSIHIFDVFKQVENNRNMLIRKYIRAENKVSRGKTSNENVDSYTDKIAKIKNNLSKLNYNTLKMKMVKESSSLQ